MINIRHSLVYADEMVIYAGSMSFKIKIQVNWQKIIGCKQKSDTLMAVYKDTKAYINTDFQSLVGSVILVVPLR